MGGHGGVDGECASERVAQSGEIFRAHAGATVGSRRSRMAHEERDIFLRHLGDDSFDASDVDAVRGRGGRSDRGIRGDVDGG